MLGLPTQKPDAALFIEKKGVNAMKTSAPIFIIGIGRTGSTVLHNTLCRHPNTFWLSDHLANKYPQKPAISRFLMHAIDWPGIGPQIIRKYGPGEIYGFWEYYFRGFRQPCRDLVEDDVTVNVKKNLNRVKSELSTRKRNRMLIKITGWPRIRFLHEVFDDAFFVHILRDGRAVVNSMLNVSFWRGWMGPSRWRWGQLNQAQMKEWAMYDHSFVALAAIQWKIFIDAMRAAADRIPKGQLLEVKYEDLCADPRQTLEDITGFCGLGWAKELDKQLAKTTFKNTNLKWQKDMTGRQKTIMNEILKDYLLLYNY